MALWANLTKPLYARQVAEFGNAYKGSQEIREQVNSRSNNVPAKKR
jgi:hypothetical protein